MKDEVKTKEQLLQELAALRERCAQLETLETARKQAEETLRESQRRVQRLFESDIIGILFAEGEKIIDANDAFLRMVGYTYKDLTAGEIRWREMTPPEHRSLDDAALREMMLRGSCTPFEKEYIRKDGSRVPILIGAALLEREPLRWVCSIFDRTEQKRAEEKIRESEKKYRELYDGSRDGSVRVDMEGNIKEFNQAYKEMLGYSEEELRKLTYIDLTPKKWHSMEEKIVKEQILPKGFSRVYEKEYVKKDGTILPVSLRSYLIKDANGKPSGMWAFVRDITERKQMAEEIRRSRDELENRVQKRTAELAKANEELRVENAQRKRAEEAVVAERQRFNDVLEMLPAYLVLLTPDYHVPFANRFFRQRFGESQGRRCFEYLFGRSEPCEICETYTVLKTMAPHDWEWTGPDGRNYQVFDFPFTDTDGSTLILEMGIDITERKQMERALRSAALYARSLIEASLDPLVTIRVDGKVMDINKATEMVIGVPREKLIGSDFADYFTDPQKAKDGYKQVFLEGPVRDYPLAIRHVSGQITEVLYHATVYKDEAGQVQGVFAAARDITERKQAQDALRESEAQLRHLSSQLLAAHETERKRIARELHDGLQQFLAGIKFKVESFLQEMKQSRLKARAKPLEDVITLIKESVREIHRIQMDLRPSILDDLGILATISWLCREFQTTYSGIRIEKEIAIQEQEVPEPLKMVIYRILQEVLNNIVKHSQAKGVFLSLGKKGGTIELSVQDNGQGFDLQEALSGDGGRRGLGLISMRERAENSGGSLTIDSEKGKGTRIRVMWEISDAETR